MRRRAHPRVAVAIAVVFVAAAAACSSGPAAPSSTAGPVRPGDTTPSFPPRTGSSATSSSAGTATTTGTPRTTATSTTVTTSGATVTTSTRTGIDGGFGEVTVVVTTADGETLEWCLLLAATAALRQRGLMFVADPTLGGYDGMLFVFEDDTTGGFWMKNTLLPLSIAYVRADGATVSTADMAPCPAEAATCPSYASGGAYRYAIEVPQGGLARLGISDRSRVAVGDRACAAARS